MIRPAWRHSAALVALALLAATLTGCDEDISSNYGQRAGVESSDSVNGTAVFADMVAAAGHRVRTWTSLSPKLREKADCIVWFPDDINGPRDEVRQWLQDWLVAKSGRTLIYVGRDFDAAPYYWELITPHAPPEKAAEVARRLARDQSRYQSRRAMASPQQDFQWFSLDTSQKPLQVRKLAGEPDWTIVDPQQTDLWLDTRMIPAREAEILLQTGDDAIVSRLHYEDGRIVLVANGSFLLNLSLVNREHRKLAGRLIEELGPAPRTVVFLESGSGGPPIRSEDPAMQTPSGLDFLLAWPAVWAFVHFTLAGILFSCARWPIFGIARELPAEARSDFRQHLEAVGKLLALSGDRAYAYRKLLHYRQKVADKQSSNR